MRRVDALSQSLQPLIVERAGLRLHSAFQPIISVVHSRVVGHEALLRGHDQDERKLSPAELFPQLVATHSAAEVNEICSRLHMQSFTAQARDGWLFINVSPDSMPDRAGVIAQFGAWLRDTGLSPARVVVEIIETRAYDECLLADAVGGFRDLGCLVAIDDFGAGESNFERVWRLRPDIVKLDRAMISEAANNPLVQRILPGLVSLIHEAGCLIVMEGIETERQAQIAVESDVDFVQGYWFSQPSVAYHDSHEITGMFAKLTETIRLSEAERHAMDRGFFASFTAGLEACVSAREDGIDFVDACQMFLAVAGVQRVYELDARGFQVGDNLESSLHNSSLRGASAHSASDDRFAPCADGNGANWYRRPYFQRAISNPGKVQISRPYLSIRDARSCVTMSMAYECEGELRVLCTDLDYEQASPPSSRNIRDSGIIRR